VERGHVAVIAAENISGDIKNYFIISVKTQPYTFINTSRILEIVQVLDIYKL